MKDCTIKLSALAKVCRKIQDEASKHPKHPHLDTIGNNIRNNTRWVCACDVLRGLGFDPADVLTDAKLLGED